MMCCGMSCLLKTMTSYNYLQYRRRLRMEMQKQQIANDLNESIDYHYRSSHPCAVGVWVDGALCFGDPTIDFPAKIVKMARRKNILIPSVDSFEDSLPSRHSEKQLVALLSFSSFSFSIYLYLHVHFRCNTIHGNANSRCQSLDRIRIDTMMTGHVVLKSAIGGGGGIVLLGLSFVLLQLQACALHCPSSFHGTRMSYYPTTTTTTTTTSYSNHGNNMRRSSSTLVMRKQKASDKRTARMQRGNVDVGSSSSFTPPSLATATQILTSTPMTNSEWRHKSVDVKPSGVVAVGTNANGDDTIAAGGGGGHGND